jgi:hypothetical protein
LTKFHILNRLRASGGLVWVKNKAQRRCGICD